MDSNWGNFLEQACSVDGTTTTAALMPLSNFITKFSKKYMGGIMELRSPSEAKQVVSVIKNLASTRSLSRDEIIAKERLENAIEMEQVWNDEILPERFKNLEKYTPEMRESEIQDLINSGKLGSKELSHLFAIRYTNSEFDFDNRKLADKNSQIIKTIILLMDYGVNINQHDYEKYRDLWQPSNSDPYNDSIISYGPLLFFILNGNYDMVENLLDLGADPNISLIDYYEGESEGLFEAFIAETVETGDIPSGLTPKMFNLLRSRGMIITKYGVDRLQEIIGREEGVGEEGPLEKSAMKLLDMVYRPKL
jgi:hypothetical protein